MTTPLLRKAVLRAYTAGTHKADVQLVGDLATTLPRVRVATHIHAADAVVNRECTVLFFDANNPADAIVIAIQGALPSAPGGGVTDHAALTSLDYASAAHTGFLSLATPQTVTAEKIIDSAVGFRFGHAAGPLLQGAASGDDLALTGDLAISGSIGLPGVHSARPLNIVKTISTAGIPCGIACFVTADAAAASGVLGIYGGATYTGTGVNKMAKGLDFQATSNTTAAMMGLMGLNMQVNIQSSGNVGAVTGGGVSKNYPGAGRPTTATGLRIDDFGAVGVATAYGLKIEDQTLATNRYIIEAGPATPYLRLVGGAVPGAGLTNLWLYEGTTPALRNVGFVVADADGHVPAGTKVAVLV